MNVLYLATSKIPSRQANSVHVMNISSAFIELDCKVTLIAQNNTKLSSPDLLKIMDFYGSNKKLNLKLLKKYKSIFGMYIFAIKSAWQAVIKKPNLVIARSLLAGFLTSFFCDTLVELHQLPPNHSRLQKKIFKLLRLMPKFRGIIVITQPLKKIFIEHGYHDDEVFVMPDGATIPSGTTPDFNNLKLNRNMIKVGYAGHLFKGRGIEVLIDIAKHTPWISMNIAGGEEEDIKYYKNYIKNSKMKNVQFHGFIEPSEVSSFLNSMDILVAPYQEKVYLKNKKDTTEKWMSPLKIFEYMASGKPVITSNIKVLKEVLKDNYNCLLCDPKDHNDWIKKIKFLVENEENALRISKNAFNDLKTKYSWKQRAKRILEII